MYLQKILEAHRREADIRWPDTGPSVDQRLSAALDDLSSAEDDGGRIRGFRRALQSATGMAVISEIKRRSPSKGDLNPDLDPAQWAGRYLTGDATCLSVLTDRDFFGGSPEDLQLARAAVDIPVLRKDFTVSDHDVIDAAGLDDGELARFLALAAALGLDALVETHDEAEVERALKAGANLIGVNQRDLVTFEVDTDRACRVGRMIPDDVVSVAESGISGPEDIPRLAETGFDAVLVGEALVRSGDPSGAVRRLRQAV